MRTFRRPIFYAIVTELLQQRLLISGKWHIRRRRLPKSAEDFDFRLSPARRRNAGNASRTAKGSRRCRGDAKMMPERTAADFSGAAADAASPASASAASVQAG
jgi:hypothetical protein